MEQEEIVYLHKMRKAHTDRLHVLELQAAQLGISCPPNILIEIEQIKEQVASIDLKIQRTVKCPQCKSGILEVEIKEDIKTYIPGLLRKINISAFFKCKECSYEFTLNTFKASKKYVRNNTKLISAHGVAVFGLVAVVEYLKKHGVEHAIDVVDVIADTSLSDDSDHSGGEHVDHDVSHDGHSDSQDVDIGIDH